MKSIKSLFKWSKNHVLILLMVLVLATVGPFTYSYVPMFIKYIIDNILKATNPSSTLPQVLLDFFGKYEGLRAIMVVGLFLLAFQAFRGAIMFVNGYVKGRLSEEISFDMRTKMYNHIQDLPYSYHNNSDTGDLIQRCTSDIDTIKLFLSAQLPQLIAIIAQFTFGAIQMASINIQLMLVTLMIVPISIFTSILYFRYVKHKFEEIEVVEATMTTNIQENVNGVRVVKAFNAELDEIKKFDDSNNNFKKESRKLNNMMSLYWGLSDFTTLLQYAITFGFAINLAKSGQVNAGDIIAALMYIGMLVWPIRGLGRIIGDFGKATVATRRIDEILDIPDDFDKDGSLEPEIKGNIEFKNVKFHYPENSDHLLNGVNFTINEGETVAIVGKTGSGKSTIANLLVRLLEVEEGEIFVNGINIKDVKKKWIRSNIGIILQDPFLYTKTVYDNINIGKTKYTRDDVVKAARIAAIDKDITKFDGGYETLVGEKGVTLSGGQKQRIAIARMLLLDKPVLIFDDSLSAVDTKTDLMIRNALKEKSKKLTSIIITHRITTAKEADKIIVLENGKVSMIGTHEELAHKEGLYKTLWDIQGSLESSFVDHVEEGKNG
ncbi:MAG: ABC transporter ATP-binding protein [Bacilli bacterium]|nr:ABC transporter ATP-binding protein [Bacilli bacterium]MDD2682078.1 ABC transporter ATP-binding protein [Bacilli bacterium]MDD3121839.1 ABC transporter ATP-binding protein [Bacilli bacterium]MDD4063830.1 ABC transporter ATP-binding protein [Bacilli bacterium]MDD4482660.1 ABC transporter ATP-binding protein [Bacilli bacterium]